METIHQFWYLWAMNSLRSNMLLVAELALASVAVWLALTLLRDHLGRSAAWMGAVLILIGLVFGLYRSFRHF